MTGASDTHRRWCVRFLEGSVESQDVGAGPPGNEPGSPRRSLSGRFRRSQRKSRRAVRNIRAAPPQRRAQPCARGRVFESGRALISARGAPPPLAAASRFALGFLGSQFSVLGFLDWRRSSSRSLNCSSASGFASASRFLTGAAVHDVADRELDDLAAPGPRDVRDLHDPRRHVPRRGVLPDAPADAILERRRQRHAVAQPHEQDDRARRAPTAGRSTSALEHLVELLRPGGRSPRCRSARRPGSAPRRSGRR